MDFSQEFIMDIAINAAGFLTAGLIGMVFYALFSKKSKTTKKEVLQEINNTLSKATQTVPTVQAKSSPSVKFIQLGANGKAVEQPALSKENKPTQRPSRKEVIQLARKMLEAGSTTDNIKRILPVSDAELALLSLNNK